MKTADQIANLESRLEFQDETIATLNDEIVAHHQRLAELEKSFGVVLEHLQKGDERDGNDHGEVEPPPPHY
jgi:SlyX protein